METVAFTLSILAIAFIAWWNIRNDRVGPNEPTTGLLAMRDDDLGAARRRNPARRFERGR